MIHHIINTGTLAHSYMHALPCIYYFIILTIHPYGTLNQTTILIAFLQCQAAHNACNPLVQILEHEKILLNAVVNNP